jgi:hypothetical protein
MQPRDAAYSVVDLGMYFEKSRPLARTSYEIHLLLAEGPVVVEIGRENVDQHLQIVLLCQFYFIDEFCLEFRLATAESPSRNQVACRS